MSNSQSQNGEFGAPCVLVTGRTKGAKITCTFVCLSICPALHSTSVRRCLVPHMLLPWQYEVQAIFCPCPSADCSPSATNQQTRSSADADKPDDTIRGQSRSPNIVPFHTLGILSSCTIVTLSLRRTRFSDIRLHSIDCVCFPISVLQKHCP